MEYQDLIQSKYASLTRSEKKIADYCLSKGKQVVHATMHEIKATTKVGDATIIRFCQKLGFTGFTDLKIEIAKQGFSQEYREVEASDFYSRHLQRLIRCMEDTRARISEESVELAVKAIEEADHIYLFGVGSSGTTAEDFESLLLRVGVKANAVTDPHFQAHIASIIGPKDIVIAFSLSGKTKDVYDSLTVAKQSGAKVIAITTYDFTPIGQLADLTLRTAVEEFIDGGSVAGKLSQLYVCDLIVQSYEKLNNIKTVEIREKVLRAILDKQLD
ncbi:MurR/RpiR family transcriptional regulator [Vaginisenegalia massiliensis]|uniref:MurR/RpiR family transcriptional regulator n=1 Tax=Vaginisenegalia massiliensis TaxID=2058294 RepID=UPI000F52BFEC|nr:MurR/RpiR family transcriptional regulator [Vaginisenegalia massiliensis]